MTIKFNYRNITCEKHFNKNRNSWLSPLVNINSFNYLHLITSPTNWKDIYVTRENHFLDFRKSSSCVLLGEVQMMNLKHFRTNVNVIFWRSNCTIFKNNVYLIPTYTAKIVVFIKQTSNAVEIVAYFRTKKIK